MPPRKTRTLTEHELEIMHVVWEHGEVTVQDVRQRLRADGQFLAPSSIRTMLGILQERNYVTRRQKGRGFLYRATVPQNKAKGRIAKDMVERAFRGSALDLVATLIDGKMVSKGDIDKVKRLIREYERRPEK